MHTHCLSTMEGVRTFLESSTIHGLAYISQSGRISKVFWILVVIAGFIGSGFMIYESFDNWAQSPVKTTIETLPISEITLPKVTVCPPKNTYTNLNYDLMMLQNFTLDNNTRNELTQYAVGLIQDHIHQDLMFNISLMEDENRFFNWYQGYNSIDDLPSWGKVESCPEAECDSKLWYTINTWATFGTISTKYFGDRFDTDKIEKIFKYQININPPAKYQYNKNVSLYIKIEKNTLPGSDVFYGQGGMPVTSSVNQTITPPGTGTWFALKRDIVDEDMNDVQMELMPGFRLEWYYNEYLYSDIGSSSLYYLYLRLYSTALESR